MVSTGIRSIMTCAQTRFAPSPNGLLHLGHVFAAEQVWRVAEDLGAKTMLRIEDTDFTRCRPAYETAMLEDLAWLGFEWTGPVVRQSERKPLYQAAIDQLRDQGMIYPCQCTRREIEASWQGQPVYGPEGLRYRGTCKGRQDLDLSQSVAWRLDMVAALARVGTLSVDTVTQGQIDFRPVAEATGDVVLVRKDIGSSYHLAVTIDDAEQGMTHVIRGEDMRAATAVHRVLQGLLGLPIPAYHFHPLLMDVDGQKLAKRDGSEGVRSLRARGLSPAEIRAAASGHWSVQEDSRNA